MLSDETVQACRKGAEAIRKLAIHEIDGATYVKQPEASLSDVVKAASKVLKSVVMKDLSENFKLTDVEKGASLHDFCTHTVPEERQPQGLHSVLLHRGVQIL